MPILGVIASSAKGAPGIPTGVTATDIGTGRAFNNGAATVAFTPGSGATATSFTATSSPGGFTATGASSPLTVTGLQSSTSYTFTVTATNAAGTSAASAASNSITATTVPQAPTIGTATATGGTTATVAYTAGATGGAAVSAYTATSSPGSLTGTGASPITVSGLTTGTAYTFTVTATNANGTSIASAASNSVTPAFIYWIENWNPGDTNAIVGMTIASSNSIIVNTSSSDVNLQTIDFTGAKTNGRQVTSTNPSQERFNAFGGVIFDPVNNYRMAFGQGRIYNTSFDQPSWFTMNSSNAMVTDGVRTFAYNSGSGFGAFLASAYRGGYAYACGYVGGPDRAVIGSFNAQNASGYRRLDNTSDSSAMCVDADTSGRGFVGWRLVANPNVAVTATNCVIQWQRNIVSGGTTVWAVACYSTSLPYVAVVNASTSNMFFVAFDNNGNTLWQRSITGFTMSNQRQRDFGACMDSSGNFYAVICQSDTLNYLFKYNSSGTLLFQRSFSHSSMGTMTLLSTLGTDLIMGDKNARNMMRYPTDGSVTGTYSYRGSSLVIAASSATSATSSLTINTVTPTDINNNVAADNFATQVGTNTTTVVNKINL
jgi:hypothetical protein